MKRPAQLLIALTAFVLFIALWSNSVPLAAQQPGQQDLSHHIFLPLLTSSSCQDIEGETYGTLVPVSPPTDRPAAQHADLNLALRGYTPTTGTLGLVDISGPIDGRGPKLYSLFAEDRVPEFTSVSQVNTWDWATNSRGVPIPYPPVTLAGMRVTPDEILRVPHSEYNIGARMRIPGRGFFLDAPGDDPNKFEVLVLYATSERITLKYTREDNVISGYTIHIENICVAPALLRLYDDWNDRGRGQLPALKQEQAIGRALGSELGIAIRDNGTFMDPRSRKDWW